MVGDEVQDIVGDRVLEVVHRRLAAKDRDPVLKIGLPEVRDHAPRETRGETGLELGDLGRRPVGREDDLATRLVQGVEGVEELLLGGVLAADEVHVVDEEEVGLAIASPEVVHRTLADGRDDVVGELLGGDIGDAGRGGAPDDVLGDRLHEMRLAEAGGTVEEERVIGLPGRLRDGGGGGGGEIVGLSDDEGIEGISVVEGAQCDVFARPFWRHDASFLSLYWHEQIHLGALETLLVNTQLDLQRMAKSHRGKRFEDRRMTALVPLDRELVGGIERQRFAGELRRREGREPGINYVIRELDARAVEQSRPDFGGSKGHSVPSGCGYLVGGPSYPARVDKSTFVYASQRDTGIAWVDLRHVPN